MKRLTAHPPVVYPRVRGDDRWGSGYFGAPRGDHKHNGVDFAVDKGSAVCALRAGRVSKIGFPYNPADKHKGHLRYVEITVGELRFRYFYIHPIVEKNQTVDVDQPIGIAQGLRTIYPGITDHVHLEIMNIERTKYFDPSQFVEIT